MQMDLKRHADEGVDWTDMAQNRETYFALVNVVMNFQVP
jgi:hypothetical protein